MLVSLSFYLRAVIVIILRWWLVCVWLYPRLFRFNLRRMFDHLEWFWLYGYTVVFFTLYCLHYFCYPCRFFRIWRGRRNNVLFDLGWSQFDKLFPTVLAILLGRLLSWHALLLLMSNIFYCGPLNLFHLFMRRVFVILLLVILKVF